MGAADTYLYANKWILLFSIYTVLVESVMQSVNSEKNPEIFSIINTVQCRNNAVNLLQIHRKNTPYLAR